MLRSPVPGSVLALVGPIHWGPWCGTARRRHPGTPQLCSTSDSGAVGSFPAQSPRLIPPLKTAGKANVFTMSLVLAFFNSCIIQTIYIIPG